MNPAELFRKAPIRLAFFYSFVFLLANAIASLIVYHYVVNYLSSRLDERVMQMYTSVTLQHERDDLTAFVAAIDLHAKTPGADHYVFLLRDPNGQKLAGNMVSSKRGEGLLTLSGAEIGHDGDTHYRIHAGKINSLDLWVGINDADTLSIQRTVFNSVALASLAATLLALSGATLLAYRSQRRVDELNAAMSAISDGQLDTRLAVSARLDDIDTLASGVNRTLDDLQSMIINLDEMSTNMAHDLKTPLNRLFIGLDRATSIAQTRNDEAVADQLAELHQELLVINKTFDALLRISRIDHSVIEERFLTVNLGHLIDNVVEMYAPLCDDLGTSITVEQNAASNLCVRGDVDLLTQLLVNLFDNSLRYCPAKASITIVLGRTANRCHIAFCDDGPGIPDDEKDKVFRRLYRVDKSRTSEGCGLGLSLVQSVANVHHASVTLSDNNPGLVVTIEFPSIDDTGPSKSE